MSFLRMNLEHLEIEKCLEDSHHRYKTIMKWWSRRRSKGSGIIQSNEEMAGGDLVNF